MKEYYCLRLNNPKMEVTYDNDAEAIRKIKKRFPDILQITRFDDEGNNVLVYEDWKMKL